MKKITRNQIKRECDLLIVVPNNAIKILNVINADGYASGQYGWNYDYYRTYCYNIKVAIIQGYRPYKEVTLTREQADEINEKILNITAYTKQDILQVIAKYCVINGCTTSV